MKQLESYTHGCPYCDCTKEMLIKQKPFTDDKTKKTGKWWYYKCPECKEEFTTNESDDLSLRQLKSKP